MARSRPRSLTDKGTTTIDQDGETIAFTCKTFKVTAETLTLKASQDGSITTDGKCTIKTTGDALIDSAAKLTLQSVQKLAATAQDSVAIRRDHQARAVGRAGRARRHVDAGGQVRRDRRAHRDDRGDHGPDPAVRRGADPRRSART